MFQQPFNMQVAGPTQAGKSTFVKKLIENADTLISPPPTKIIYIQHEDSTPPSFNSDIPCEIYYSLEDLKCVPLNLIVIDDLYVEAGNSKEVCNLFTRGSHHNNCSVILTTQNLFSYRESKYSTTINRNCKYMVLFKSPRDCSFVRTLDSQMYPEKKRFLTKAYRKATEVKHGYLLVDTSQECPDHLRLKRNLFREIDQYPRVFVEEQSCPSMFTTTETT